MRRKYNRAVPILPDSDNSQKKVDQIKEIVKPIEESIPTVVSKEPIISRDEIKDVGIEKKLNKKEHNSKGCLKSKTIPIKSHLPTLLKQRGLDYDLPALEYNIYDLNYLTPTITEGKITYGFYSCKQVLNENFKSFVPLIFQTGDIIIKKDGKTETLEFDNGSYTDTTYYSRAKRKISNKTESILVAGDLITFECIVDATHRFDLAILITEVAIKLGTNQVYSIESSIKTGVMEKPPATTIYAGRTTVLSTMKDTLGHAYVVKKDIDLSKLDVFLEKNPDETYKTLVPTNMSTNDDNSINYHPNFTSIDDIFDTNRLHYEDSMRNPRMVVLPTATDVDLPNSFPEPNDTDDQTIKPFDCYVKGLIMINRFGVPITCTDITKVSEDEILLQNMNYDMFDYNEIKVYTDTDDQIKFEMPWLTGILNNNGTLNGSEDCTKLLFANPQGSPFALEIGPINDIVKSQSDNGLNFKFNIYSPKFFVSGDDNILKSDKAKTAIKIPSKDQFLTKLDESARFLNDEIKDDGYIKQDESDPNQSACSIV